jgi:NAD(P)-dependent dehydrogenase (short-subunit alcohol dehydrogenase family)
MNKVVLVTGASSGLGQAVAAHLATLGHRVYGTSRALAENQAGVHMLRLDVTDDASVAACVEEVLAREGRIDVLVNNAGFGVCGAVEDTSMEEAHRQLETNFFGPVRMVRAVMPHMRRQQAGTLITVGSLAGQAGLPFQPFYSASKFALAGLNEALRLELVGSGIQATLVDPGDFKTGFTAARVLAAAAHSGPHTTQMEKTLRIYQHDEEHGAPPREVARLIGGLVMRRNLRVRYAVGPFHQRVGVWLKRLVPAWLFERAMLAIYLPR